MQFRMKQVFDSSQAKLREKPSRGLMSVTVESRQVDGFESHVSIRDFSIVADEPKNFRRRGQRSEAVGTAAGGAGFVPGSHLSPLRGRSGDSVAACLREGDRRGRSARLRRRRWYSCRPAARDRDGHPRLTSEPRGHRASAASLSTPTAPSSIPSKPRCQVDLEVER